MSHKPPLLSSIFRGFGGTAIVLHFFATVLVIYRVWMGDVPPSDEIAQDAIILLWGIVASGVLIGALFFGIAQILQSVTEIAANCEVMARTIQRFAAQLRQDTAAEWRRAQLEFERERAMLEPPYQLGAETPKVPCSH